MSDRSTRTPRQELDALIERTRALVDKNPKLAARILKHWVERPQLQRATHKTSVQPVGSKYRKAG